MIKLLNVTDVREAAWDVSRPYTGEKKTSMKSLDKMDFSLQMLKTVTLHIKSSAFFRELLTTIRPYAMWSQSSRVNAVSSVKAPDYLEDQHEFYSIIRSITDRINNGCNQDEARLDLPIAHVSEFVFSTDIRTLICFLKSLEIYNPKLFGVYGQQIIDVLDIGDLNEYKFPSIIKDANWTDADEELAFGTYKIGSTFVVKTKMSISLRAQFARHTGVKIKDNYFWKSFDLMDPLSKEIDVILTVDDFMWQKVISHRSCWIAHYEMYEGFILSYLEATNSTLTDILPCKGQKLECSCTPDVEARIAKMDPGIPCPIWTKDQADIDKRTVSIRESEITNQYAKLI